MIQIELGTQTEATSNELAAEMHMFPKFVARQAIESILEDRADYLAGIRPPAQTRYTISQKEMVHRSELSDEIER